MRITMEMITFNAASIMPPGMLRACIEAMYPFVDEIIICEGATRKLEKHQFDGDASRFTNDGRSTDDTLEVLHNTPDPRNKIRIIHSRGWWNGKTSMMNECDKHATGDYVWQVDSDEFYSVHDITRILCMMERDRPDAIHFFANHFWGGYNDIVDDPKWGNDLQWMRIFRREKGGMWRSHEPPQYQLPDGRLCNHGRVVTRERTNIMGIRLNHYGFVWRKQAEFKQLFYKNPFYLPAWDAWQKDKSVPIINGARTTPFTGRHPEIIMHLLGK